MKDVKICIKRMIRKTIGRIYPEIGFGQNLTNFAGSGIEDPRADKILPWAYSKQSSNSPAEVKFKNGWRRSMGVDMIGNDSPSLTGGPLRSNFSAAIAASATPPMQVSAITHSTGVPSP